MIKLHLGCGKRDFGLDWDHIDISTEYSHIKSYDVVHIPYDDNSVDLIYASHLLEYFDRDEAEHVVLPLWRKALKPGGILRVAVPDFEPISRLYQAGFDLSYFVGPLYGKMVVNKQIIYHKTVYDYKSMIKLLIDSGFGSIRKYNWRTTEHSKFDDHSQAFIPHMEKDRGILISLNVEGVKV